MASLGFYVAGVGVVVVVLADELGRPATELAWVASTFGFGLLVMAFCGPALLRAGASRLLVVTAVVFGLGCLLLAIGPVGPFVYAGAVLQGLGAAGFVLAAPRLLHGPDAEAKLTRVNAVASLAGIAAPLLLGVAVAAGMGRLPLLLVVAVMVALVVAVARLPSGPATIVAAAEDRPAVLARGTAVRRWLVLVCSVAVEFCFVVWGAARLTDAGLGAGQAGIVAAAFPVGMATGRVFGSVLIRRLPMVGVGAGLAAAGTILILLDSWALVGVGQLLAGLGVATLYPISLARLMATPGLRPEHGASLGALASGTAITTAPVLLAVLAGVVELRVAFLLVLPLLGLLLALHTEPVRRR